MSRRSNRYRAQPDRLQVVGRRDREEENRQRQQQRLQQRRIEEREEEDEQEFRQRQQQRQQQRLHQQNGVDIDEEEAVRIGQELRLEALQNEPEVFDTWIKKKWTNLEENFRIEIPKRLAHFLLVVIHMTPSNLAIGTRIGHGTVTDWNACFRAELLPHFNTNFDWRDEQLEVLEPHRAQFLKNLAEPFIFKIFPGFSFSDGERVLMTHFQPNQMTTNLLKRIATFLHPSWRNLNEHYVAGVIRSIMKTTISSLWQKNIYCSKCNEIFSEKTLKSHVARHHKTLFNDDYGAYCEENDANNEFNQIVAISPTLQLIRDHAVRTGIYWVNARVTRIETQDREGNNQETLRFAV